MQSITVGKFIQKLEVLDRNQKIRGFGTGQVGDQQVIIVLDEYDDSILRIPLDGDDE